MPAPTYSAGTAVLSAVNLTHGQNSAALIDLSNVIQGMVWCQMETGASNAPTTGTTFSLRRVIGATASGNTTLSSVVSAISGTTLTISALENAYSSGALVFIIEDTASGGVVTPGTSWTTNASYSTTLYPPIGVWALQALNGDATYAVTVTVLTDTVPTIQ